MHRITRRRLAIAALLAGMAVGDPAFAQSAGAEGAGRGAYRTACAGCHKWHGDGGGGYGGAALSLRETELDREQMIEAIKCGRIGTGMPYHVRDAYADGACYGVREADIGEDIPPGANQLLRPAEVEAVADYVLASVKGQGEPSLAACQAFWGEQSNACDEYKQQRRQMPVPTTTSGSGQ